MGTAGTLVLCLRHRGTTDPIVVLPRSLVQTFSIPPPIGSRAKMAANPDCSGIWIRKYEFGSNKHGWGCDHRGLRGGGSLSLEAG